VTDLPVRRVDFGYFIRPGTETVSGAPHVEPCLGYLIEHPDGTLLMDTGMGDDPWVDGHYRPSRVSLEAAVRAAGARLDEIRYVVNCHLHFDHCGGNPLLPGRPVFTQRAELAAARETEDYTIPELIDPPGITYTELDGETEILPGVLVVPTPGHTDGHQSVVVCRPDGTVIVAGQSHDTATGFTYDALAHRAAVEGAAAPLAGVEGAAARLAGVEGAAAPLPVAAAWMERLLAFDPARVVFAHDNAVWTP
jgi:N-acyl homoserine lactone hydrolase